MLELMRKHARSWIMKTLLGIIIVVFVFYFGTVTSEREAQTIANLDGKILAVVDYQKEYGDLLEFYRQRFGPALNEEIIKGLNLRQQAFDNLIFKAIALNKAEELKLTVTDEDVRESILKHPGFQFGGAFDRRLYENALRSNRMTAEQYELRQREMLTIGRLEGLLAVSAKVSDKEMEGLYRLQNEQINLNYLALSPKDYAKQVSFTREDLEKYLKEEGHLFRNPEHYQVQYLAFLAKDQEGLVEISQEEINSTLEKIKDQLKGAKPATLLRDKITAELRSRKALDLAQTEAKKAYETIYQEENLEGYALKHNLKIHTTDFFPLARVPEVLSQLPNLPQTIPLMGKDEISRLLDDGKGYYILRLVAKRPSYIPPLAEIEKRVAERYLENQAAILCRKSGEEILEQLKKGADLGKLALERGIKVSETGFFRPGGPIPRVGEGTKEINEALYLLTPQKPLADQIYLIDGQFYLFALRGKRAPDAADLEANREAVRKNLERMKREELVRYWIDDYKNSLIKDKRLKIKKEPKDL